MPRVAKFGRGREKKTYPINSPLKKRAKAAGSGELDCSSEESVVGLLNAININMHPGDTNTYRRLLEINRNDAENYPQSL